MTPGGWRRPGRQARGDEDPVPVRAGLDRLLDHLTGASVATTKTVFDRWDAIVGEPVASHTRPQTLRDGVLSVAVDDPAWASQLRFLEPDLREKLAAEPGGSGLVRIEFVVRRDAGPGPRKLL